MRLPLLASLLLSLNAFGQETPAPTTEEEYNYMSKGYRVQVESGLDMKKGYKFASSEPIVIGNYSFDVRALIREEKDEIAGILVISKSKISGNTYYVAVPIGNPELMNRYYAVLDEWDSSILTAYSYVISSYFASALNAAHELEKSK